MTTRPTPAHEKALTLSLVQTARAHVHEALQALARGERRLVPATLLGAQAALAMAGTLLERPGRDRDALATVTAIESLVATPGPEALHGAHQALTLLVDALGARAETVALSGTALVA